MILDTGAVSSLLAGDRNLADILSGEDRHQLPSIVLGEYRYGLRQSRLRVRLEELIDRLEDQSDVLSVGAATAREYALVRERLRAAGKPIPENDVWIAALALEYGRPVVSRDAHFDRVHGLKRVAW